MLGRACDLQVFGLAVEEEPGAALEAAYLKLRRQNVAWHLLQGRSCRVRAAGPVFEDYLPYACL